MSDNKTPTMAKQIPQKQTTYIGFDPANPPILSGPQNPRYLRRFYFEFEWMPKSSVWESILGGCFDPTKHADGTQTVRGKLAEEWAEACKMPDNQQLVPLNRYEGGLESPTHKFQMRFKTDGSKKMRVVFKFHEEGDLPPAYLSLSHLLDLLDTFRDLVNQKLQVRDGHSLRAELIFG